MKKQDRFWGTPFYICLMIGIMFLVRIPYFNHPSLPNSDHTIVGLQGLHILKGEWEWFLWRCGYQASWESLLSGIGFLFFGISPYVLMAVSFSALLITFGLIFLLLRKSLTPSQAFFILSPLLVTSGCFLEQSLFPPRQWCFVPVFLALFLFLNDKNNRYTFFVGAVLVFFALYIDYFAVQFMGSCFLCAGLSLYYGSPHSQDIQKKTLYSGLIPGILVGGFLLLGTRLLGPVEGPPLGVIFTYLGRNAQNLFYFCLPDIFNYKRLITLSFSSNQNLDILFYLFRLVAAFLFMAGLIYGAVLTLTSKEKSVERILGLFGTTVIAVSLLGFLVSFMAIGSGASRYLTPLIFVSPFLLTAVLRKKGMGFVRVFVIPYLVANSVMFLSDLYASRQRGPVFNPTGLTSQEKDLKNFLLEKNVHYGFIDYWLAYRLTFLLREEIILVPHDPATDRYSLYRKSVEGNDTFAYIFLQGKFTDPIRKAFLERLRASGKTTLEFNLDSGFDVIIVYSKK
jgi:hypothetical protein